MRKLKDRLDPHYTKICLYAGVTVLLTLAAGMVLYFSSGFFAQLWLLICAVLEPAIYGALIAYLLNPAVIRVSHAFKRAGWMRENYRTRRQIGVVVCLLALLALIAGVVVLMMAVVTRSLEGLSVERLREFYEGARDDIRRLAASLERFLAENNLAGGIGAGAQASGESAAAGVASDDAVNLGAWIGGMFQGAKDTLSTMLFSIIFSIYILMDGDRVGGYCLKVVRAVAGKKATDRLLVLLDDADRVFSGYIRGQFSDALVVGLLSAFVLSLAGVPYGAVIGLLTGTGNLIPYVGAPLGIGTTILVCLVEEQYGKMAVGIVCLALIMFVDSNVINPKLLSDNVEVHPLLVVAALIAGGAVGGLAGMLVAVPAAAFLKIQLDRWMAAREADA